MVLEIVSLSNFRTNLRMCTTATISKSKRKANAMVVKNLKKISC